MTPAQRENFQRLLNPRHIAFIGGRDAAVAIGEARRAGFEGEFWPVNPKRDSLENITCFNSVEDLPEAPDAVFIAVPVPQAIETINKLRTMGTGGIVCYTAGFREAGVEGETAEAALIEAAGDMALIGPNCYGIINYLTKTALWPFAHGGSTPGYGCAIITQSGMLSSDITMSQRSLPLTHMISVGNQAVITIEDLIGVLCEDNRVRAIGVHIEGIRDVEKFSQAALKTVNLGKPIVALKSGSSAIGMSLTSSHTGSLSGEDDLYEALFERVGIVRVHSPSQLLETLKYFSVVGAPIGNRVVGFTCSGGGATMLADHAEKIGLEFPAFLQATHKQLTLSLPSLATVSNPLDYTTPIWGQAEITGPVFSQAMADGFDAAVLVQDYPAAGLDESQHYYVADAEAFVQAAHKAGIPAAICATLPENLGEDVRRQLIASGIAPMQGINEALDAIAAAADWNKVRNRILADEPNALLTVDCSDINRAINEVESKSMLQAGGINVPQNKVCNSEEAAGAAAELGFPVVLKMVHHDLLHKTEVGAVKLDLGSEELVSSAVDEMSNSVKKHQPDACTDRFLLEATQDKPIAELIVSVRQDAQFGLAMTIGSGGILVELLEDAVTLLLPCSKSDILRAIKQLKISKLMTGYRGGAQADMNRLADSLVKIAELAEASIDEVAEIEINPLFVYEDRVCAVDALIHVA